MTFVAKFKINKSEALKASFKVNEQNHVKAVFKANFRPSKVSQLENDLEFQTKQQVNDAIHAETDILNERVDTIDEKVDTEVERLDDRIDNILIDVDDIVQAEAEARQEADNILDAKIDSEADRLENLIQSESDSINTRIDNEVSNLEEEIEQSKLTIEGSDLIEATTVDQTTTLVSKSFIFIQAIASDVWVIEHNLNKRPSVTLVDSAGSVQIPDDITYNSDNKVTVKFLSSFSGKAYLN